MTDNEMKSMTKLLNFLIDNNVEYNQIAENEVVVPIPVLLLNFTEDEQKELPLEELCIADTMTMKDLEINFEDRINSLADFAPLHIRTRKNGGYDWTVYC